MRPKPIKTGLETDITELNITNKITVFNLVYCIVIYLHFNSVCKRWRDTVRNQRLWRILKTGPKDTSDLMPFLRLYIGNSLKFFSPWSMTTEGQLLELRKEELS